MYLCGTLLLTGLQCPLCSSGCEHCSRCAVLGVGVCVATSAQDCWQTFRQWEKVFTKFRDAHFPPPHTVPRSEPRIISLAAIVQEEQNNRHYYSKRYQVFEPSLSPPPSRRSSPTTVTTIISYNGDNGHLLQR